jgi:hypothetical protein
MNNNFQVLTFRKINLSDISDDVFNDGESWSRVYEYPLVINKIKKYYKDNTDIIIHNSSWGFKGIHVTFKNYLDNIYPNTIHSDIRASNLQNTTVYDITKEPSNELKNKFDVVINISTLEEVDFDHLQSFKNLLDQVKQNGLLIITFDLPGLQLEKFENLFNQKLQRFNNEINGLNSRVPFPIFGDLSCGIIVLRKI